MPDLYSIDLEATATLSMFGVAPEKLAANRPQFLVVAPPKTCTTWLAENLRRHPALFVPPVKELKFFSSRFRTLDLDWYLNQFAAGVGKVKGEASPSYALLPMDRIRLLKKLFPDLKLVFLMREPIERAWSHARHTWRYREANFTGATATEPTAADWRANFNHDWMSASGDYLGQLRRWLTVFPREQMYVGFSESIARQPAVFFRGVLEFLGVDPHLDFSSYPLTERILPGETRPLTPDLRLALHRQWHVPTVELATFLKDRFDLETPVEWRATLEPATMSIPGEEIPAFADDRDDACLARVLEQEDYFPTALATVLNDFLGYDFHSHAGRLFAIDRTTDRVDLASLTPERAAEWEACGMCFSALTLSDLKERVTKWVITRMNATSAARAAEQAANLVQARTRIDTLERQLAETMKIVATLRDSAMLLTPREQRTVARVRTLSRRVRSVRAPRWLRSAFARLASLFA